MLAAIRSAAVLGIDAYDVTVEVDVALGLPQWIIVGLPANAVKESRERVSAALTRSRLSLTAFAGSPTMNQLGRPSATSTSTVTS